MDSASKMESRVSWASRSGVMIRRKGRWRFSLTMVKVACGTERKRMDKGLYRRKVLEDEEAWRSDFFRCQER